MLKKIFKSRFLVLPIAVSLMLSACGGGETKPSLEANVKSDIVTPAGELPVVTEPVTLSMGVKTSTSVLDFDTNKYTLFLEEKTGIDIEFEFFPATNPAEKIQMMLASNSELPDVLMALGVTKNMLMEYGGNQGFFYALNDYIDEYGYWTQKMFEDSVVPYTKKQMMTADEKIYYLPQYIEQTGNRWNSKAWINKTWLDKLGLSLPTTTEEFKNVLKAFKEGDPNGNGKADEICYTGSTNGTKEETFPFLMNSFIYCDYTNYFLDNNGKVEAAYVKDEWKAGLKYMRELAKEGLFDTQSLTQDTKTLRTILRSPEVLVGSWAGNSIDLQMGVGNETMLEYASLPPLKGPEGVAYATRGVLNPGSPSGGVITKYCENPAAAFRLMDFMLSEEASLFARYGEKGTDWLEPAEGDVCIFEAIGAEPVVNPVLDYGSVQNSHWGGIGVQFRNQRISDGMIWDGDPLNGEYIKGQALNNYIGKAPENTVDVMTHTIDESEEFESLKQLIRNYVREHVAMYITGEKDIDSDWENYLAELDRMGLERMIELAQIGYDRFLS